MNFPIKKETFFSLALVFVVAYFSIFFRFSSADVIMVVNDPTGTIADNGLCSIVEAIININTASQAGSVDCPAGEEGSGVVNIISLATDVTLTGEWPSIPGYGYGLASISSNFTLNGNGHTISRDSDSAFGIWRMVGAYNYEFNDVTFVNGRATNLPDKSVGGGMAIYAPLSVRFNNVTFENNEAVDGGALFIRKDSAPETIVEIINSSFIGNFTTNSGSGIYLTDTETIIQDSRFEGNYSSGGGDGGGIYSQRSNLEIYNTYFLDNGMTASLSGGSILSTSTSGTKILNIMSSTFENSSSLSTGSSVSLRNNIDLSIENSTFFGDSGPGSSSVVSFLESNNSAYIRYNTFYGAIDSYMRVNEEQLDSYIENNIFMESSSGDLCVGDFTNFTFTNNMSDADDADCGLTDSSPSGVSGTLALNGGDLRTLSLLSNSGAVDAGAPGTLGCPDTDARGYPRPYGSTCDVGAYEYTGEATITISETGGETIVTESGAIDTYTVSLGKGPSSSVTINLLKSDTDFNVSPSSITFTTLNWFMPQTITVSAVDNEDVDGDRERTISHEVTTLDASYDLVVVGDVTLTIMDNDEPPTPPPTSTGGTSGGTAVVQPPAPPAPILGCTISFATNYNPSANQNDGSCIFPVIPIPGCTNPLAINYSQVANTDNGGCILPAPEIPTEDPAPEEAEEVEETEIQETDSEIDEEPIAPQTPPTDTDKLETNIPTEKPTLDERGEVLGQEEVVKVSENLSVAGLALPLIAFIITQPAVAASIPVRLWSIFPTLLGFKRRKRPWGTVYDSVTKQPLDPVHVSLVDESGKEVATTITDIDGRFGFLVPAGRYKIIVNKNNYEFPSKKMAGKDKDELYGDLYFSEYVEIKGEEDILIKNIPMDPVNFNWNEFEKSKNKDLMKFYSKREVFFANISNVVFYAGFISSVFLMLTASSKLNSIIFAVYLAVFALKFFNIGPKKPGYVYDSSGFPLSYGIVRVFSAGLNREISHAVIGKTGKYYALVRNGEYYLKISKKTGEDSYEEIHQTDILKVRSGYIKEKISAK